MILVHLTITIFAFVLGAAVIAISEHIKHNRRAR